MLLLERELIDTYVYAYTYSTVHLKLHTRMIFSVRHHATFPVVRQKITHGIVHYHAWKKTLPHQEIATRGCHSHCHMWLISKAMPRAVTRDEETHYTHCFEAYLYCIINYQSMLYR